MVFTAADGDVGCCGCIVDEGWDDRNTTDSPGSSISSSSSSLDGALLSHSTGLEREPSSA